MKSYFLFFILVIPMMYSCGGSKQVLSSTQNTCTFLPPEIEAYVDMYVDEVDGKPTKFNLADSVVIDEGEHNILVRLEYQPSAGSSLVVGGLGNLLLRFTANKTFSTKMDISVAANQDYRFVVTDSENGFKIRLVNETTRKIELEHAFELKDGKFTRVF